MKKFVTLFLAAALSLGLAVGASADFDGAIKKGTPTVDGELDAIYYDSFNLQDLGTGKNGYDGTADEGTWSNTAAADVYFLYDDKNLYICALVEDDDVLSKGEVYATGDNPWQNDNVEFRLSLDGTYDTIKVGIDAYGYNCYGLVNHYDRIDYSTIKYITKYTDTSYVIEVAIPCTKGQLDMIKAGKLGFAYQLNDINADGKCEAFTTSFYGEAPKVPVFVALSDATAQAVAAPVAPAPAETAAPAPAETAAPAPAETAAPAPAETAAPAPAETAAPAPAETEAPAAAPAETEAPVAAAPAETTAPATTAPTTAPSTFDPAIIAVALTAASGAAFVLASKKH